MFPGGRFWLILAGIGLATGGEARAAVANSAVFGGIGPGGFALGSLLLLVGLGVGWRWRHGQIHPQDELAVAETADPARGGAEQHRDILRTAMDGYLMLNVKGCIREANETFCRMTGYAESELMGMPISALEAKETPEETAVHLARLIQGGSDRFETRMCRRDGGVIEVEVTAQYRPDEEVIVSFVRDVSARRAAAARIRQLSRLYATLSECGQLIVHSSSAEELLPRICRDVVERGGMRMAWVSEGEAATGEVRTLAAFGEGRDYLEQLRISLRADEPEGRGPTGTAIREKRPVWVQDFAADERTAPWQERARQYGWASSAAIPIFRRGKAFGALTIYSDQRNAFDPEVQGLLLDMAGNLGFALETYAQRDAERRAETELQNLRAAVEQSADAVVITSTKGVIEYVNPAFEKITGYEAAEVIGRNPRILSSGEQAPEFYRDMWATLLAGKTWQGEFHNRHKNGSLYWEWATISPVRDETGETLRYIAIKENITERKRMQASLREALEQAEAASRAKSEFLAVMSHELRTPLNGVIGFADLLAETPLNSEQADFAHTIRHSGEHLLSIVNDILDFSSLEKDRLRLDAAPLRVTPLLEETAAICTRNATEKGLVFRCDRGETIPEWIVGDARRVRQILINLLGNAVKFTAAGSVVLRVTAGSEEGRNYLDFEVEDSGPGIAAEVLPRLFQPFSQGDSSLRRRFDGAGLGLAISQRLARAMGGRITVTSVPGLGSRFTFRLPFERAKPVDVPRNGAAAVVPRPGSAGRVLVVEDDRINARLACKILEGIGWEVEVAGNGREAVDAFARGSYHAILMDMQMPVMNGLEATEKIRAAEAVNGSRVPIIALTANAMPGDRERCLAAGMDDFLTKPFRRDEMATKLARWA